MIYSQLNNQDNNQNNNQNNKQIHRRDSHNKNAIVDCKFCICSRDYVSLILYRLVTILIILIIIIIITYCSIEYTHPEENSTSHSYLPYLLFT